MKPTVLVLSCEHATNVVPSEYAYLFAENQEVLNTHRALDLGAAYISDQLSQVFGCEFAKAQVSRLLIDCNRSLRHPTCFSEFSKSLSKLEKQKLIEQFYNPFRLQTETYIDTHVGKGHQVLHLSIHSFAPELKGIKRNAAIALLYDPARHAEKEVARVWRGLLLNESPSYNIRMNYPYAGKSDGFTSALRKRLPEKEYLGIEVEVNQALVHNQQSMNELIHALVHSLQNLLQIL